MNEDEFIEFTAEELEAIREGITEEVFEIRQFAIQKVPVLKMFQKRIERLEELLEMQRDLFPGEVVPCSVLPVLVPYDHLSLADLFNAYYINKNTLKQRLFATFSIEELSLLLKEMCENEKTFANLFDFLEIDEQLIVSKEPDPMDIHEAIKEASDKKIHTLADVKNNTNKLPFTLLKEMKRLLLLSKKY